MSLFGYKKLEFSISLMSLKAVSDHYQIYYSQDKANKVADILFFIFSKELKKKLSFK